ncbi:MAG: hypothetical protein Q8897_00055 [Sweet potato little leaf phytoplasma]|uniref:Uncharacterized protein n=2 Tax=Candidatus Phytoplasma TaxID=33926 RepID=A0ABP2TFX0_PEWBP|nr:MULTISPECIES: hypothetical protein [Phytoplasma]MDV3197501.1 hypothetical protein [Candidatus Phytoplasma australasiaticum]QLL36690.1 hypothetical protein EPWB_v2c0540 ['Echinacea purpurea' witches'-broom phytoplasma]WEX20178.1 MAG: hypothetical protein TB2022_0650 [Candidatus Phytoplasma aurantifolia]EMR14541.1 hypothetical protein PNWB_v1c2730 [Peanut witches'-broom phytoplasma NTU2011]MDO7986987.1 hypothetical protein [Sweet potato little leaf phytoplasma]
MNYLDQNINHYRHFIGAKVSVAGEQEIGVVTRIDIQNKIVCVLFKKMREVKYRYPEVLDKKLIKIIEI